MQRIQTPVVARGVSRDGLGWQITVAYVPDGIEAKPYLEVKFTIDPIRNGGHYYIVQLPVSGVHAHVDSQIEQYSEGDLSGITDRGVDKLNMKMGNGKVLTVEPALAPARLRRRFFWLRGVRFFDFFFRAPGRPQLLTRSTETATCSVARKAATGTFSISSVGFEACLPTLS